jgi:S1-C subfamily serine protease
MRTILAWLFLCVPLFAQPEPVKQAADSVGLLYTDKGAGSCVYIGNNLCASAYHVIEGSTSGKAIFGDEQIPMTVKLFDKKTDAAIVELEKTPSVKAVKIGKFNSRSGKTLYCIGYDRAQADRKRIFFGKTVNAWTNNDESTSFHLIASPAVSGNSGGAVLDEDGQLVATITATDGTNTWSSGYLGFKKLLENK